MLSLLSLLHIHLMINNFFKKYFIRPVQNQFKRTLHHAPDSHAMANCISCRFNGLPVECQEHVLTVKSASAQ